MIFFLSILPFLMILFYLLLMLYFVIDDKNIFYKYFLFPTLIISIYLINPFSIFIIGNELSFFSIIVSCFMIEFFIQKAANGEEIYLRPIAGINAMEEAVGRSTEMGKSVLFVPGISGLDQIDTIAGLTILGHVAGMTADYETDLHVPVAVPIVMETAKEACKEAYLKKNRTDLYREDMVHYVTDDQFAYAAGVNGIMLRDKPAAVFYQGKFYAESLILAETGNSIGAIQIAGTGSSSQIPFFVTACDYTLIGEEFYAASAYLSGSSEMIGSVKGQDYVKLICMIFIFLVISISILGFLEISPFSEPDFLNNFFRINKI
tara:strand:+ start:45855 stop:46811 length:957 start_codon:yes stop_codon:yes gene_type:complete